MKGYITDTSPPSGLGKCHLRTWRTMQPSTLELFSVVDATRAVRTYAKPVLLVHGWEDGVVPVGDLGRLAAARRASRPDAVTETLVVEGGRHSWLYEFPEYRATVARFLTTHLGGPFSPDEAASVAASVPAERLPDPERLTTLDEEPGGFRSLTRVLRRRESAASASR